ncbi:MAG TPA: GNAT family N-acetyltransferase [Burkholderiales bacterium]|nr:GNAT family N-acetyltransferase [Burkholderiales bacterium]
MDMHSPLVIREAIAADLDGVLRLYAQPDIDNGETLSIEDAREIFTRFQRYPDYKLYVVTDGNDVVGSFALLIMDNLGHLGTPSGVIEDVVVDPSHQGKGIGRQMMAFAIERCRDRGCYKVALSSNLKRERAHQFYDSIGFERHGYSFRVPL